MDTSGVTHWLAIWGAITGTIGTVTGVAGLVLRVKQHRRDNPALKCSAVFKFEHSSGDVRPLHRIVLRSTGRRPVAPDFIRLYLQPRSLLHRIFRTWYWRQGLWKYDMPLGPKLQIGEGQKHEERLKLPSGIDLSSVRRVVVYDQAGNKWPLKWPNHRRLVRKITHERLHELEKRNLLREVKVIGYFAGGRFHIYTQWNAETGSFGTSKGRFFHFKNKRDYESRLSEITHNQVPKLLDDKINEIA